MADHRRQLDLFPPGDDPPADAPRHWDRSAPRSIAPGDWLSIRYEGRTVLGMVYRIQHGTYAFAYWDKSVLRFGAAGREDIGPWDEGLTAQFRGQIAVTPDYVGKCIAGWLMQPEPPPGLRPNMARWQSRRGDPPQVQQRLFPE